jgi:hypothetical protein
MSTRNLPGDKGRPAIKADKFAVGGGGGGGGEEEEEEKEEEEEIFYLAPAP